jgi:hypothetical protein
LLKLADEAEQHGFSLGEVEAILARMFEIHPSKRATFSARLQQLQRMGLPPGANQGRGKRYLYKNWQLAEFALYLDLLDAGVPPSLIKVHMGSTGYYSMLGAGQIAEAAPSDAEDGIHLFFQLNALNYLSREDSEAAPSATDQRMTWGRGVAPLLKVQDPAVVVNLSKRLDDLKAAVRDVLPSRRAEEFFPAIEPQPGMMM